MATGDPEDALDESGDETLVAFDVTPGTADAQVPSGFNEWRNRFEARLSEPARDRAAPFNPPRPSADRGSSTAG